MKNIMKFTVPPLVVIGLFFALTASGAQDAGESNGDTLKGSFPKIEQTSLNSQMKPHIGLQLGFADPANNHDVAPEFGIEIGYQPIVPISLGFEVTTFDSNGSGNRDLNRTRATVKGAYNLGGTIPVIRHSYLGVGLGPVMDEVADNTSTHLGLLSFLGFDVPLNETGLVQSGSFTLGANASFLAVLGAEDNLALNGQMKYWF